VALVGRDDVLAILSAVGLLLTLTAASGAFRVRVALPLAPRPERPVLVYPRSGGGKAERFALAAEARARGIELRELAPGADLEELVRDAVSHGANALAMAGWRRVSGDRDGGRRRTLAAIRVRASGDSQPFRARSRRRP
jgi:hypothetical protein